MKLRTENKTSVMSFRLWEGSQLEDVCIMRCGKDMPMIKSQLGMISILLGAVSEKPEIVSCGGVGGVDVLKTLDKMLSSKVGLAVSFQYLRVASGKTVEKTKLKCDGSEYYVCIAKVVVAPN